MRSVAGEGSVFIATVRAPATDAPVLPRAPKDEPREALLAGLHVLVAEDGEDNQHLIRRLLESAGAHVTLVENGEEAVRSALSSDPALVLMDIQMPILDGEQATIQLRRAGFDRPIIAVTAHALEEHRARYLECGLAPLRQSSPRRFASSRRSRIMRGSVGTPPIAPDEDKPDEHD